MKKLIGVALGTLILILGSQAVVAEDYYATGATQEEAREQLALSIIANVSSEVQEETQVNTSYLSSFFTSSSITEVSETRISSRQESNVTLTSVRINPNEDGTFTARMNKEQFRRDAQQTTGTVLTRCDPNNLPESWDVVHAAIDDCLFELGTALGMATIAVPERVEQIVSLRSKLQDAKNIGRLHVSSQPDSPFSIDSKRYSGGDTVYLPAGSYTLTWSPGSEYCAEEKQVEVQPQSTLRVHREIKAVPTLTINTNVPDAHLELNGQESAFTRTHQFDCNRSVSYRVSTDLQTRSGTVQLSPGDNRVLTIDLLTKDEAERLRGLSNSFRDTIRYRALLGMSYKSDFDTSYRLRAERIHGLGALRYGYGGMFSFASDNSEYEVYGLAAFQMTEWAGQPLHLGPKFGYVPYAGLEIGIGRHERAFSGGKTYTFGSGEDFFRDYLVFRYVLGSEFPIDDYMAITLQGSYAQTQEESFEISLGLNLRFH